MSRIKIVNGHASFKCPGCRLHHSMPIDGRPTAWQFNGDTDRPTFSPSILARGGCCYEPNWHQSELAGRLPEKCDKGSPDEDGISMCHVCHSLVRDGRIEFLGDCTHALAGQTVDLPEVA